MPLRADSEHSELLARPIGDISLAFVDVETTGFSAQRGHRVCEIAIVRRVGERVEAHFTTLVNPECSIGRRAAAVNGITRQMVQEAPCFRDIVPDVVRLLDGAAFVAHNAGFDRGFLDAEFGRVGRVLTIATTIDTLALARAHLAGPDHSLGALARSLGLTPGEHRAPGDVGAVCGVFDHLVARLGGWSTPLQVFVGGRATPWPRHDPGFRRRSLPPWFRRRQGL